MPRWVPLSSMTTICRMSSVVSNWRNAARAGSSRSTAPSVFFERPVDRLERAPHGTRTRAHALRLLPGCDVLLQGGIRQLCHLGAECFVLLGADRAAPMLPGFGGNGA